MERWADKVALVTGASAGIGAATVVELVKYGMKVVAVARRVEKIEELNKTIKGPGELYPLKGDISNEEDINAIFTWIKTKFGTLHVIINNAGILRPGIFVEQDPKFIREVIDVNVIGLTLCTQKGVKLMRDSGVNDGHIILINSVAGHAVIDFQGYPQTSIYTASKHAVTAINEIIRQELRFLKTKIKVTSISPGYVTTEIGQAALNAMGALENNIMNELPEMPALESKDIADGIVYVLGTPPHVQVHELTIKPVGEQF